MEKINRARYKNVSLNFVLFYQKQMEDSAVLERKSVFSVSAVLHSGSCQPRTTVMYVNKSTVRPDHECLHVWDWNHWYMIFIVCLQTKAGAPE